MFVRVVWCVLLVGLRVWRLVCGAALYEEQADERRTELELATLEVALDELRIAHRKP